MRSDRQNHTRSPWLRGGLSITYSFMNGEILKIKKSFGKSNKEILEIKKNHSRNQTEKFWKSKNHSRNQTEKFWKSKNHSRNQRRNFGNQKIIREIKRTRQESKYIIILVILLEHRIINQTSYHGIRTLLHHLVSFTKPITTAQTLPPY